MTSSKDEDQENRIPYEPPRLFDLGGGVAHAAKDPKCQPGGSPGGAQCQPGGAAGNKCQQGGVAGGKCQVGTTAAGGQCKEGATAAGGQCKEGGAAAGKCKSGGSPSLKKEKKEKKK